ncbi:insulinase family protein [Kordiimonas sp. SCSIO 12603]|uniref:M16 family metallopeptidase n=1 Tax=Kordiimonas sp. SCSIO 12603 TaxID=2829596 RepID=UPI002107F054|nr:M16 family metallopeptidase [Kordiimonas sp. SCSIO 12603]UTW58273.1 insulinase family protein [Kordiimonas sp. SCSIO 12603]
MRKFVFIALLFFVSFQQAYAAGTVQWPHTTSNLKPDPKIKYGQLANGMRYAVMANEGPAEQAAIRFLIGVGSRYEYDNERGIAHFVEHMAFNGSKNVPEGEMVKILQRHGLAFGADVNASTSYDQTIYQLDLPNVKQETLDASFMLMREVAGNITFDADAIERERGVVLAEKRGINPHALATYEARIDFLLPDSRLMKRRPIGTEEVISTVPRETMVDFYNAFYRPDNAFFVIVGDIDEAAIEEKIKAVFGDWQPVGDVRNLDYAKDTANLKNDTPKAKFHYGEKDTPSISMSLYSPYEKTEDTIETRVENLVKRAAHSIVANRMTDLVREGKATFLGAGANFGSVYEVAQSATLSASSEPEKWEQSFVEAIVELRRALEFGFTQAEIKELHANWRTSYEYGVNAADKRPNGGLANYILGSFHSNSVATAPDTNMEVFERYLQQVTADAMLNAMREIWSKAHPKFFFVSNEQVENAEARIMAAVAAAGQIAVTPHEDGEVKAFAYTEFGPAGKIVSRTPIEGTEGEAVLFENNVMLNIMKTDYQDDTVQMRARFGGGVIATPKDKPGINILMGTVFTGGGLGAHSATDLRKVLAGRTASANIAAGLDNYSFRSAVTPKDVLLQLQLWGAYLLDPAYRKEPLVQFRKSVETIYQSLDSSPGAVAGNQVGRLIYSGDNRFFLPEKNELLAIDEQNVRTLLKEPLIASALEVTIVGDIDVEETIDAFAQTLGALPLREAMPRPYDMGREVHFPSAGTEVLTHQGGKEQAILQMYWPTVDYSDITRSAKLDILTSALNQKVRDAVRERVGAAYAPSVSNLESNVFPDFGYIAVGADLDPKDISQIIDVVNAEISEAVTKGFTDDEIERARKPLLEGVQASMKSNNHWLSRISRAQSEPESVQRIKIVEAGWKETTSEDMQELAAKYLQPEKAFIIKIVPTE